MVFSWLTAQLCDSVHWSWASWKHNIQTHSHQCSSELLVHQTRMSLHCERHSCLLSNSKGIVLNFASYIQGPQNINSSDFGIRLTFPLVPPAAQSFHYSSLSALLFAFAFRSKYHCAKGHSHRAASMTVDSETCTKLIFWHCNHLPTVWNCTVTAEVWKTNNIHFHLFGKGFFPRKCPLF